LAASTYLYLRIKIINTRDDMYVKYANLNTAICT